MILKWPKQINPDFVSQLIRAERDVRKALDIFNSATGEYPNGFKHNESTFGLMIGRLASSGQFAAAESLLQRMDEEKCQCPEDIFITMCRAYGQAHMPLEALRTFHKMKEFQCKPTQKSYTTIFAILVKENHLKMAHKFYAHMNTVGIKPNVSTCNILIKALSKSPKTLNGAFRVFREMPERGCIPDSFTYSTLIDGLCKHGRLDEAKELFKDMEIKGGCPPDVVSYTTIIHGLCMAGQLDDAMNLLHQMVASKIYPNKFTYTALMHGLCKGGRSLEAVDLLREMISKRQSPNIITYSTLISGLCNEQKIQDAMEILDQMKLKRWSPDAGLYNKLITGLCSENKSQEAANLLDEMVLSGVAPTRLTRRLHENMHNIVIQNLCKGGNLNRAFQNYLNVSTKNICPSLETFNLLVDGFCKKGEVYKAAHIVSQMFTNDCIPDNFIWSTVVKGFWSKKKARDAALLLQDELTKPFL